MDEVHYTSEWNFSSGISKEIHENNSDNSLIENWFASTLSYGSGDYGTPGTSYEGSLGFKNQPTIPGDFIVYNLFPNPFNSSTTIKIHSGKSQTITIQTFDVYGREIDIIKDKHISAGNTEIQWAGNNYSSGVYFLKISNPSYYSYKKLVLVK